MQDRTQPHAFAQSNAPPWEAGRRRPQPHASTRSHTPPPTAARQTQQPARVEGLVAMGIGAFHGKPRRSATASVRATAHRPATASPRTDPRRPQPHRAAFAPIRTAPSAAPQSAPPRARTQLCATGIQPIMCDGIAPRLCAIGMQAPQRATG